MEIVYKKVNDLIPYENNPRINEEAVEYVKNSIKEFGFKVPIIIDKNNVIVAGHTRLKASKLLNLEEVPCIIADDLTEEQIKALRLADNKVGEKSLWDYDLLNVEIDSISNIDMSLFDFDILEEIGGDIEIVEEPEIKFTEILNEEHNYIVLYFDNEVDWLQAESLFNLEQVQCPSTRKDGKIMKSMKRIGVGRVLKGKEVLERLRKEYENIS